MHTKKSIQILGGLIVFFGLIMITGCGGGASVGLIYPADLADTPWCRWDVSVAKFTDARTVQTLGMQDKTTQYTTEDDVTSWVRSAMLEEFESRGCQCSTAKMKGEPRFIVNGEVLAVELNKTGFSEWNTKVKVRYVLMQGETQLYAATHTGEVEKPIVMDRRATSSILAEGLQDITVLAVEEMIATMTKAASLE